MKIRNRLENPADFLIYFQKTALKNGEKAKSQTGAGRAEDSGVSGHGRKKCAACRLATRLTAGGPGAAYRKGANGRKRSPARLDRGRGWCLFGCMGGYPALPVVRIGNRVVSPPPGFCLLDRFGLGCAGYEIKLHCLFSLLDDFKQLRQEREREQQNQDSGYH